jgi:hypothetical protein
MCTRAASEAQADHGRIMCINGKPHDMARIDEEVEFGTTEIWEIFSIGMAHPFQKANSLVTLVFNAMRNAAGVIRRPLLSLQHPDGFDLDQTLLSSYQ